jgi:hypothetical protein
MRNLIILSLWFSPLSGFAGTATAPGYCRYVNAVGVKVVEKDDCVITSGNRGVNGPAFSIVHFFDGRPSVRIIYRGGAKVSVNGTPGLSVIDGDNVVVITEAGEFLEFSSATR